MEEVSELALAYGMFLEAIENEDIDGAIQVRNILAQELGEDSPMIKGLDSYFNNS